MPVGISLAIALTFYYFVLPFIIFITTLIIEFINKEKDNE